MTRKKRKKSGSARIAWVIILALCGLGAAGTWYVWTHGGHERFIDWFYGDQPHNKARDAASSREEVEGPTERATRPADPLWRGPDGRARHGTPGNAAKDVHSEKVRRTAVTLKQARAFVRALTNGEVRAVQDAKTRGRYLFEVEGGVRALPFDTDPVFVEVDHHVLVGPFGAGAGDGFVVPLSIEDPEGPVWQSRYVGVVAWAGRPGKPGRRLGSAALQAPGGWFVSVDGLDAEGDGTAEVLLEVEYRGPQGLLMREASVWFLGAARSKKIWSGMTLDDAPGLGAEEARAWEVRVVPARGKGENLEVTERLRTYNVKRDMSRTLAEDRVVGRSTVKLSKGRKKR